IVTGAARGIGKVLAAGIIGKRNASLFGADRGGTYVPPHMEDGKVVPAKVE
ncbi:MAG: hypothetical protein CFH39_00445, partial [Alphaproteobacteria bacterium MarineAlpha10_Bin2]